MSRPSLGSSTATGKIRVLVAKLGLDAHTIGITVLAQAMRNAGMEVIYSGLRQTPENIVRAAMQEDVDAIGLSVLSGAHMTQFSQVLNSMKEQKLDDVLLFGGGIIPGEDRDKLRGMGVGELFGPGTPLQDIVDYLRAAIPAERAKL